jgi:hypothetical protein
MNSYLTHSLGIHSVLSLPELIAGETRADVIIRLGSVARPPSETASPGSCFHATDWEVYLFYDKVGAFLIREGREIVVEPVSGVEEHVLRLFILGPALALLLQQRGLLVLHASAVAVDGGAVAFLGGSGWGKSTMAAALHARGYDLVSDDVTAVYLEGDDPMVLPGFPQLKLWPDVAVSLGKALDTLPRLHPQLEKRACRVVNELPHTPLPLSRSYVLDEGTNHTIEPIGKQDALVELIRHSYGVRLLQPVNARLHFLQCANLASKVPVRRLKRLRSLPALSALAQIVEEDLVQPVC